MKNESVNEWLDADHVRALAEGLMSPSSGVASVSHEKMFGDSFEGFSAPSDAGPAPSMASAPLVPVRSSGRVDSPFEVSPLQNKTAPVAVLAVEAGIRPLPLTARLQAFGTWLKEQIPTQAYFICDRNGEIVVDEIGSGKLLKVARTLAHASRNAGRQVSGVDDGVDRQNLGSLNVKIGTDQVMEVVPRHTRFGLVILGLIVPRPLSREVVASVSRALGTVMADPSAPRKGELEEMDGGGEEGEAEDD